MEADNGLGADTLINNFRKVRAKIEAMDAAHEEAVKPYKNVLAMIKEELKNLLNEAGADSVKTEYGTAYKSIKTSVKLEDKISFVCAILEQVPLLDETTISSIIAFMFLAMDIKPNKTYVEDFIAEMNDLPAGVQVSRYIDINVRK
jgi:hypothetical protein